MILTLDATGDSRRATGGGAEIVQPARSAVTARRRLRDVGRRGLLLLLFSVLAIPALSAAHFAAAFTLITARAGQLGPLLLAAVAWHLHRLTRERSRHALIESLVDALSVPASIEGSAEPARATLVGAGVARAGLIAVVSSEGDVEADRRLLPLAVAGARRGWDAEYAPVAGRILARPIVQRERVTGDRWLLGFEVNVGRRPWVARIPIRSGDEELGLLLFASRRRGWLRDRALLRTVGTLLAAALDHSRQYQVAFERSRELEEQNARRREFLYAIAHELRSPLTSIRAFAKLLTSDRALVDGNHELLLASLSRGVDRLATFVNDLLDLGRVEESVLRLHPATIDVTGALRGAETILRPSFMAREQALTLDLPEGGLPAIGDERALEQIMLNLLSNANRFTPARGAITVRAAEADGRVRIEVCDSGPDIDPADRIRIFEPFYRVHRAGAPEVPGSGLAVAHRLTELQGDRIWADAAEGGGTRFCFELPGAARASLPAPGPAPTPVQEGAREEAGPPAR